MEEALQKKADLILSYHPPIFRPMKRITWKTWKERLVIRALENTVGIYSPHTAYDAAPQGVNNWLAKGLGEKPLVLSYLVFSLSVLWNFIECLFNSVLTSLGMGTIILFLYILK